MTGFSPASVEAVVAALCGPKGTAEELRAVASTLERARAAGVGDDAAALARIKNASAGLDPLFREPALACLTGDLNYYVGLIAMLRGVIDLAPLEGINQIYWSMARQIFLMRMNMNSVPNFTADVLFPFYQAFVQEIARRHSVKPAVWRPKPQPQAQRKIILVANQFLSLQHQPSRDLLEQAAALQDRGDCAVTIFNTNMMPDRYYSPFVPPFAAAVEEQFNGDQTLTYNGRHFRILSSTLPGLPAQKIQGFIAAADDIDPDAVISIGGSAIIADLLAVARPCVCLQTTSGYTVSLARLILDYGGVTPPGGDGHYAKAWRPFRLRLSLRPAPSAVSRADHDLPDDAFACLVVGNRLDYEASDGFLDLAERFLDQEPRAVIVFAGPVESLPARLAARKHASRLRCLGYVDQIVGLMAVCDAYLNPRRTGGGASALQALEAGLPIVSLAAGDVASVAGPDFCVADDDAFIARLADLVRGPSAPARAAARDRYAAVLKDADNTDQLVAYIDEAQRLFLHDH